MLRVLHIVKIWVLNSLAQYSFQVFSQNGLKRRARTWQEGSVYLLVYMNKGIKQECTFFNNSRSIVALHT